MSWKATYQTDKQAKIETRISEAEKVKFHEICASMDMKPAQMIRYFVEYAVENFGE